MESPEETKTRPSAISVAVGYHRPTDMSGPRVQVLLEASYSVVSLIPLFALTFPPTIRVLPFPSCVWPAQKRLRAYAESVKLLVAGSQRYSLFGASSQASIESTFPF